MRNNFLYFLMLCLLISCQSKKETQIDVSNIDVEVDITRFDKIFYSSNPSELKNVKANFPDFFPVHIHDSVWNYKLQNIDEQELFEQVQKKYSSTKFIETELEKLFKHVKYYNLHFEVPSVFVVQTNIDYEYRVLYSPPKLLISLDCYLGKNHEFYSNFPQYIKENNTFKRIVVDVANQIINKQIYKTTDRTFIGKMIFEGKKLYLLDTYTPWVEDVVKVGYSLDKFNWSVENEEEVWRYFVENDLLFSTDTKLNKRFIDEAPFSKFYLAEDNASPGRIGAWVGWQIVRSFMNKNNVSLQALMKKDAQEIFKNSGYKPKR